MKIIITGSHFTPAQAVIEELIKQPDMEITYIGRKFTQEGDKTISVESQVLSKMNIKFLPLTTGRLQRFITIHTIFSLLKIPFGFIQAFYYLLKVRPQVILSFGGYVAVPVIIDAWLLSIPIIIHEQTLVSGLSNQIASRFADKIAISFTENKSFNKPTILTGNPLRKEIIHVQPNLVSSDMRQFIGLIKDKKLPLILITGGNQGSHIINESVLKILDELTNVAYVVHQTGDSKFMDYEKLLEKHNSLGKPERYFVKKWLDVSDWSFLFSKADLAVSRAGMNTLIELAYHSVPTLVIPIPYLYKNEQMVNANFFNQLNLVKILPQNKLTSQTLLIILKDMLKDRLKLKKEAQTAKQIVIVDAAKRLALETMTLVR